MREAPLKRITSTTRLRVQQALKFEDDMRFDYMVSRADLQAVSQKWEERLKGLTDELAHLRALKVKDLANHDDVGGGDWLDAASLLSLVGRPGG